MPRGRGSSRRGRGKSSSSARRPRRGPELAPDPDRLAAELCAEIAREARGTVGDLADGLDAQLWASSLVATWSFGPLLPPDFDPDEVFGIGLVNALEDAADSAALATLRALAAVGSERLAAASTEAADRLARSEIAEPGWAAELAAARPCRATVMRDPVFDDGVSVFVEYERSGAEPYSVATLIDHNLGGIAKEVLVGGSIAEITGLLSKAPAEVRGGGRMELVEIEVELAGARMREALWRTERTLDAPVGEDFASLRAIADAHARAIPGADLGEEDEVSDAQRDAAFDGFFASAGGKPFAEDNDALELAILAIDFGADYVGGVDRPLRWSPTVVELFMTWYLPAKVAREQEFFDRVPALLEAWVRYAGRARGLREDAIEAAAAAVGECAEEMVGAVGDETAWGPAKVLGMAAHEAGVDLTDDGAMQAFVDRWNDQRAA